MSSPRSSCGNDTEDTLDSNCTHDYGRSNSDADSDDQDDYDVDEFGHAVVGGGAGGVRVVAERGEGEERRVRGKGYAAVGRWEGVSRGRGRGECTKRNGHALLRYCRTRPWRSRRRLWRTHPREKRERRKNATF